MHNVTLTSSSKDIDDVEVARADFALRSDFDGEIERMLREIEMFDSNLSNQNNQMREDFNENEQSKVHNMILTHWPLEDFKV